MEDQNLLAKDDGTSLRAHLLAVNKQAVEIYERRFGHLNRQKIREAVHFASILHDIGKATNHFQSILNNSEYNGSKPKALHNEVAWAFCATYLKIDRLALDAIHWHHGITNQMAKHTAGSILETLSPDDLFTMKELSVDLLGAEYLLDVPNDEYSIKAPAYYPHDDDVISRMIIRACVVAADRNVSAGLTVDEHSARSVASMQYNFDSVPYGETERTLLQREIADKSSGTTIAKAPAGFGKTLAGLMWAAKRKKKLIWVCPRNTVAHSVYKSITGELDSAGMSHVPIEMFLTGERVASRNADFVDEFDADIIVTNIDNFLSCTTDNSRLDRIIFVMSDANVVFDEYHEFIQESALFALFVNIMCIRHNYVNNAETLMLSATPDLVHRLWNTVSRRTNLMPSDSAHYPAAHTKKYEIQICSGPVFNSDSCSLLIYNAISNAQRAAGFSRQDLIHGNYTKEARAKMFNKLYDTYGKAAGTDVKRPNLVGTHIVQASLDVSFNIIEESVLSPNSTVQRFGRCNRWGTYDNSVFRIFYQEDPAENMVRRSMYDEILLEEWIKMLSGLDRHITLDELYGVYNEFNSKNEEKINKYNRKTLSFSKDNLSKVYPRKFFWHAEDGIITAGSNKLRDTGNEIFYIVEHADKAGEYVGPFNKKVYFDFDKEFDLTGANMDFLKRIIWGLTLDDRFGYSKRIKHKKHLDNIKSSDLKDLARRSDTPMIRLDYVYSEVYGVIKREIYNEIIINI